MRQEFSLEYPIPRSMDDPSKPETCPHSGLILTPNEKNYMFGKFKRLEFADKSEIFYHHVDRLAEW